MRKKPTAVFMAFGTKGDVYPIAAIAAAFASDQKQYEVDFVTHSAHQNLKVHLEAKGIEYFPVSSPSVMSFQDTAARPLFLCRRMISPENIDKSVFRSLKAYLERTQTWMVILSLLISSLCAPSSFERQFQKELPLLYEYFRDAPTGKIGWEDVIHWLWPLFTEDWGPWRSHDLHLSFLPFADPVTGLPKWHERPSSPLLLYGLSKEVVECPGNSLQGCSLLFVPCYKAVASLPCKILTQLILCLFLSTNITGHQEFRAAYLHESKFYCMGYLKNPQAFLKVLGNVLNITSCRFILFTAGYGPLDAAIKISAQTLSLPSEQLQFGEDQTCLFGGQLFCFSGEVPYNWLFPRCAAAIHHGGSGSTAAALRAGIPQVICPFILDQFYWAERMFWLGVASEPLKSTCLLPDKDDDCYIIEAANMLVGAINHALSPEVKSQASQIAKRISAEDGVSEAVRLIKEEMNCINAES